MTVNSSKPTILVVILNLSRWKSGLLLNVCIEVMSVTDRSIILGIALARERLIKKRRITMGEAFRGALRKKQPERTTFVGSRTSLSTIIEIVRAPQMRPNSSCVTPVHKSSWRDNTNLCVPYTNHYKRRTLCLRLLERIQRQQQQHQ